MRLSSNNSRIGPLRVYSPDDSVQNIIALVKQRSMRERREKIFSSARDAWMIKYSFPVIYVKHRLRVPTSRASQVTNHALVPLKEQSKKGKTREFGLTRSGESGAEDRVESVEGHGRAFLILLDANPPKGSHSALERPLLSCFLRPWLQSPPTDLGIARLPPPEPPRTTCSPPNSIPSKSYHNHPCLVFPPNLVCRSIYKDPDIEKIMVREFSRELCSMVSEDLKCA
ncbi:hypothetical protein K1719_024949 [Acacia pycnantha]|nr:hypothetical protein K1719_024949 [Acacia pycnantha]